MLWWFKCQPVPQNYPSAHGPFSTRERAELAQMHWLESPECDPEDPGEVLQADAHFHKTLKCPMGYQMFEGTWHLQYSDGTLEPVS